MRLEVDVTAAAVGDVRVPLRRTQVGVAEHLLHGSEIRSAFEQVRREGVAQEMRMHAPGLETGALRELPEDQERPGSRERAAARVQEELGPVAPVEVGATHGEVAPHGLRCRPPERHQPLLSSLAEDAHDAFLERDARLLEAGRLGDAKPGAVQELDESAVAQAARSRPGGCLDEPLGLGRRQGARQRPGPSR